MTVFWIVVGCLVVASLLFVVPPLLQRKAKAEVERAALNVSIYKNQLQELEDDLANGDISQEYYDGSREEIQRRLLEDTAVAQSDIRDGSKGLNAGVAVVTAAAVPVLAVTLYFNLGSLEAMNPEQQMAQQAASPHGDETDMAAQIEMMVGRLAQRLQDNPQDIEGWVMLGRSMSVLGRYDEAVQAYENAIRFAGNDPNVLTDYADALAMAGNQSLEGKPLELLQKALSIDPNNQKALWLIGTALFERGDFAGAIEHWSHLLDQLPPGSEDADVMRANIKEAESYRQRQLAGEFGPVPPQQSLPEVQAETQTATAPARISGRVSLAAGLRDKLSPDATLFVFARAVNGPPMPLAIVRARAGELPLEFNLDESMAMMPSMSLANFNQVVVGARISESGNAMPQSGDLQGMTEAVAVGTDGLEIVIDSVVP